METLKAIALRKSVRSYKPEQISDEVLDIILEAGFKAPAASDNYDSLHIKVFDKGIKRSEKKSKFPMYHDLLTCGPHL